MSNSHAPTSRLSERLRSPWARLVLLLVVFIAVSAVTNLVNTAVDGIPVLALPVGVLLAVGVVAVYRWVVRRVEHREAAEFDPADRGRDLRRGTLLGLGLFTATILVIAVFGSYRLAGWGSFGAAVTSFGLMCTVAVTEEILFRAILFRYVEEIGGTRVALAVSAALFGLLHLLNPDASVWGAIAIALEAGLMLGAAYTFTRSLWLPIGLHLGWNFCEGGIFATTVSGSSNGDTGLFESVLSGPAALSGGAFGPEASVVAILFCALPTWYFLRQSRLRGHWRTRGGAPAASLAA